MGLFGFLVNQEKHSLTLVFLDSNVSNWILHYLINEEVYRLYEKNILQQWRRKLWIVSIIEESRRHQES